MYEELHKQQPGLMDRVYRSLALLYCYAVYLACVVAKCNEKRFGGLPEKVKEFFLNDMLYTAAKYQREKDSNAPLIQF